MILGAMLIREGRREALHAPGSPNGKAQGGGNRERVTDATVRDHAEELVRVHHPIAHDFLAVEWDVIGEGLVEPSCEELDVSGKYSAVRKHRAEVDHLVRSERKARFFRELSTGAVGGRFFFLGETARDLQADPIKGNAEHLEEKDPVEGVHHQESGGSKAPGDRDGVPVVLP